MKTKKLLYVLNGLGFSKGMPIGGADKRVAEIGQRLAPDFEISVLTTDEGKKLLETEGLAASYFVTKRPFFWRDSWDNSLAGRAAAYFYLTFWSQASLPREQFFDFVYSSSDFFFDILPCLQLRRRCGLAKTVAIVHHLVPPPWRRRGSFWGNFALFLSQKISFFLMRFFDLIFVPGNFEGVFVRKRLSYFGLRTDKLKDFRNGVDTEKISHFRESQKSFEACFVGGLRPSKGIFDLVAVWSEVVKDLPAARVLVIGGGADDYLNSVRKKIKELNLSESIILYGVVTTENFFSLVSSARIFISPSLEEGWGIALLEALCCGLPAVVYNLPAYNFLGETVSRVEVGDFHSLARKALELLGNPDLLSRQRQKGIEVSERFSWAAAAQQEKLVLRDSVSGKQEDV